MSGNEIQELNRIVAEIRDNQRLQLERQGEALALQREQVAMLQRQAERNERIQERAERLQDRSAQMITGARRALAIVLPIVVLLIAYLSWLLFR